MKPGSIPPVPELTSRIAKASFPKGTLATRLRDHLGSIYQDEDFCGLYSRRGQPSLAPWRLALITVLQALESLPDRQAALAVQSRIDWKYALSLPLDDPGFDFSILTEFRTRLLEQGAVDRLLEPLLHLCQQQGWIKGNDRLRADSTHVLALVRELSSAEAVGEALRACLNDLAVVVPDWLSSIVPDAWFDRYVDRVDLQRVGTSKTQKDRWRQQIGEDSDWLLQALSSTKLMDRRSVNLLRQIWSQHYELKEGLVHWRDGPAVRNQDRVVSPYEIDARASRKRETVWTGYKVHVVETCHQDRARPSLIVEVQTTPATTQDVSQTLSLLEGVQARGIQAGEVLLDQGYLSGEILNKAAHAGHRLLGPVPGGNGWQTRVAGAITVADFVIDEQAHEAMCPKGERSRRWYEKKDRRGVIVQEYQFAPAVCGGCEWRERCTKSKKGGRVLSLAAGEERTALEARRKEQGTPAFVQEYALRSGVESTWSAGVRAHGMRQSRYRGARKVLAQQVAIAVGINLCRIDAWLQETTSETLQRQQQGKRSRRPPTPFARLQRTHLA
jgi:transposase